MRKNVIRYARYKKRFFLSSIMPFYSLSVLSIIVGIFIALAVISKTPTESIRGFGDVIAISGENASIVSSFLRCSKYHLAIILISTSFLGAILVPLILAYRGFSLCCGAAALTFEYGMKGVLLAWLSLGITGLISMACLLVVSTNSISDSYELFLMRYGIKQRALPNDNLRRSLICVCIMIVVAFLDYKLIPLAVEYILK